MPFDASTALPIEACIIDEALTILGPNGEKWVQGVEVDEDRHHCMIGAIRRARFRLRSEDDDTARLIIREIQRESAAGGDTEWDDNSIVSFNDRSGRSFDQVREIFLMAKCEALNRARRDAPPLVAEMSRILGLRDD